MSKLAQELSLEEWEAMLADREAEERRALAEDYYYGVRKVSASGSVSCLGKRYSIGRSFAGRRVRVRVYVDRLVFEAPGVRKEFAHKREPLV